MKWMKKSLVLALAVAMGLAAAGCGGDDDDKDPLIGKWKLDAFDGQPVPAGFSLVLTFRDNGMAESVLTENGATTTEVATWSADGGTLTITSATDLDVVPYSISGNTLTLIDSEGVITLKRQ